MEQWKAVKDYEEIIQISSLGRVKSLPRQSKNRHGYFMTKEKIINGWTKHDGYQYATVLKDGKKKHFRINRLVADAFIPNTENKPLVNHKDGNKQNNEVSNLEWATSKENLNHAYDTGLNKKIKEPVPIIAYDYKTGKKMYEFKSFTEAKEKLGVQPANISKVIKGTRNHAGGYVWKYKED